MDVSLNRNPFQPLPTEEWSVPESPDAGVRNTHNGKLQKQSKGGNLRLTGRNYRVIVSISDQDRERLYAYTTDNCNKQKPWHLSLVDCGGLLQHGHHLDWNRYKLHTVPGGNIIQRTKAQCVSKIRITGQDESE